MGENVGKSRTDGISPPRQISPKFRGREGGQISGGGQGGDREIGGLEDFRPGEA